MIQFYAVKKTLQSHNAQGKKRLLSNMNHCKRLKRYKGDKHHFFVYAKQELKNINFKYKHWS